MSIDQDSWVPEDQESVTGKLQRKMKQSPLVPVGLAGFAVIVAYGLYRLKGRGDVKMSVHLIHTRVAAQACVVAATALGTSYSIYKEYRQRQSLERSTVSEQLKKEHSTKE
ncbi:HIG1 domain family member 1B [Pelobates cultripes]|uniref:HIG1 domain family member 1B n=1 Tax=Pelobates cultripes TaxID=61616 RepID=A0AAD1SNP5_PELCU|nr:HIG1 domain family member 1B [Pelobates cultripes]